MKARLKTVIATTACVALTGAGLLASMGAASASSTTPGWEPDPNALGSIVFYDSTGKVLTGGTSLSHLADFAAVTTGPTIGANGASTKATMSFAMPDHTKVTGAWSVGSAGASTNYPSATAPAPLAAPFANPTVSLGTSDANLTSFMGSFGQDSTAGYADVFQVRVKDSGNSTGSGTHYWATDIQLVRTNGAVTGWTVLYPSVASSSTVVTQTSGLASPQATAADGSTQPITLTSTTTPAGAGSVQFFDNGALASTQPANASGVASFSPTPAPVAAGNAPFVHSYTSQYVAPGGVATTGSTSAPLSYTVTQTPTVTGTSLAYTGGSTAFSAQTFTATVNPSNATGSVAFYDNGSATPMAGALTNPSAGSYVLNTSALDIGNHSVVAAFTATGAFTSSTSSPAVTFTLAKPACPGDPHAYPTTGSTAGQTCSTGQSIQVAVTPGYLTISTPYSATTPFVLPAMTLNAAGTLLSTSANFPNVSGVAGSTGSDAPLVITSTLAGDPSWTASVTATDLVGKLGAAPAGTFDKIDGQNVGITGWAVTTPSSNTANGLAFVPLAAASGVTPGATGALGLKGQPKTFATTPGGGNGTVQAYGLMTITAPTNTIADTYTGTITFSVA